MCEINILIFDEMNACYFIPLFVSFYLQHRIYYLNSGALCAYDPLFSGEIYTTYVNYTNTFACQQKEEKKEHKEKTMLKK